MSFRGVIFGKVLLLALMGLFCVESSWANFSLKNSLPPKSHIYEIENIFGEQPEDLKKVTQILKSIEKNYDIPIYIIVLNSTYIDDPYNAFRARRQAWLSRNRNSLLFIYTHDIKKISILRSTGYSSGEEFDDYKKWRTLAIPEHRFEEFFQGTWDEMAANLSSLDGSSFLVRYLQGLEEKLAYQYLDSSDVKKGVGYKFLYLCIILGGAVVVWIFLLIGLRTNERRAQKKEERGYFPEVFVAQRFKAPFAGGMCSEYTHKNE